MTKRLVAVGYKRSGFHTQQVTYSVKEPEWQGKSDPKNTLPDSDLIRKIELESSND